MKILIFPTGLYLSLSLIHIWLEKVTPYTEGGLANPHRYRTKTLPAAGALPREEDFGEQMSLV